MSQSKVVNEHSRVENNLKDRLIGTWVAASVRKTGKAGSTTPAAVTISFSHVVGTFPDFRAESSNGSILLSGNSWLTYRGNGACLHLGDGKQLCRAPLDPEDRMTLWVAPPGTASDNHDPTENVTVLTLVKGPGLGH